MEFPTGKKLFHLVVNPGTSLCPTVDLELVQTTRNVNGTRDSVRKFQPGKRAHLFRFSTFSGNFPVGRTDETCSIYRRTGNSGGKRPWVFPKKARWMMGGPSSISFSLSPSQERVRSLTASTTDTKEVIWTDNLRERMAAVEENWQMKLSTIKERTTVIFNNELLSDVKFMVPVSEAESETRKTIPAHKLVLAISSPVFYAMFYGQLAEAKDCIELPDCEYDSLLEFLRYLYSDEANLTGSNVMHVLYLANKYMVPSLAEKCGEYLRENLSTTNVFSILPHARKFEDKDLEGLCWQVIEENTEEAVTSDDFVTLERSLVESVVKRERLTVKEVDLFKAVDRWATKESDRKGITTDGESKRRIIGENILKAIRFPMMSQKEFVSVVFDSKILNFQEISELMKYYSDVELTSPLPFIKFPRLICYRVYRFSVYQPPGVDRSWAYSGKTNDGIFFSVNKSVKLHGIQHFGREGCQYTVSTEVNDTTNKFSLVKKTGSYISEIDEKHEYFGFTVCFDSPLQLHEGKRYEVRSLIQGPLSWYGEEGNPFLECSQVQFNFYRFTSSSNGTTELRGQFAAFLFSK